jgi:tetratricopeptide (TPR) repeat protein
MSSSNSNSRFLNKIETALNINLSRDTINKILGDLERVIHEHPKNIKALVIYSRYQLKNMRPDIAGEASFRVLTMDSNNIPAKSMLLRCYMMIGDSQKAFESALALKLNKINDIETLEVMGDAFVFNEEYSLAKEVFRKLAAIQPNNVEYLTNFGSMLHYCNDAVSAEAVLKKSCRLDPSACRAHWFLSQLATVIPEKNHIALLESSLVNSNDNSHNQIYLNFSLAKEKEDIEDYDGAFNHLKSANEAKFKTTNYDNDEDKKVFSLIRSEYEKLHNINTAGYASSEPIFIVGMPRTGTTLVEQVMGTEENVFLAGELQAFYRAMCQQIGTPGQKFSLLEVMEKAVDFNFKDLGESYINLTRPRTGKTSHFVDKMPANFLHLGMIHKALPNAKFVHLIRDPIDTCLSNFKTLFGAEIYPYSYDLNALANYFHQYQELMAFWKQSFGKSIITIKYEDLVKNPQMHFKSIFEHCGLKWENKYLHYQKLNTFVGTASAAQVRKPIYTTSVQKWRKFEAHLTPLIKSLDSLGVI